MKTLKKQLLLLTVAVLLILAGGTVYADHYTGDISADELEHSYEYKFDEETHWKQCRECGEIEEGSKDVHHMDEWIDRGDGTHCGMCTVCFHSVFEAHTYDEDGKCTKCGAVKPTEGDPTPGEPDPEDPTDPGTPIQNPEDPENPGEGSGDNTGNNPGNQECTHEYVYEHNGTEHWEKCSKCGHIKEGSTGKHNNVNGTCSTCKAKLADNTQAVKPIPQTGINNIAIFGSIVLLAIFAGYSLYKDRK